MAKTNIGVPIKLFHEAEGHVVTVELRTGDTYRGLLEEAEDTMNCKLSEATMRARDGQTRKLEHVYLRGSQVKYIVLPDILTNAPIFKKIAAMRQSSAPSASAGRGAAKAKKPKKPKTG